MYPNIIVVSCLQTHRRTSNSVRPRVCLRAQEQFVRSECLCHHRHAALSLAM